MPATGVEAKIYDAIAAYVSAIVVSPALPIAMPNVIFNTPDRNGPYLVATIVPNMASLNGLAFNSTIDNRGILQISVVWKAGTGLVSPMNVAAQIVNIFRPGTTTTRNGVTVRFERQPRIINPLQASDMVTIPVVIAWRCPTPANIGSY